MSGRSGVVRDPGLHEFDPAQIRRVQADAELGPIFKSAITDWDAHVEKSYFSG